MHQKKERAGYEITVPKTCQKNSVAERTYMVQLPKHFPTKTSPFKQKERKLVPHDINHTIQYTWGQSVKTLRRFLCVNIDFSSFLFKDKPCVASHAMTKQSFMKYVPLCSDITIGEMQTLRRMNMTVTINNLPIQAEREEFSTMY